MTKAESKKSCFVICPIGKESTATRDRSDKLLKYVLKPVFEPRGYSVERADQLSEPGMITNQIVKKIVECDILLADLTGGNPNVFYELAIRHGLKKPFIHMIEAAEAIPFDNAQVRTIPIDLADLDSVDRAKKELQAQAESIEQGNSPESPISIAFDLEALKASGNTDEALLAGLFAEVSQIRNELREIRRAPRPRPRPTPPSSADEMADLLERYGDTELAGLVRQATTFSVSDDTVTVVTALPPTLDHKIEQELGAFLRRYTGRNWKIDTIPF